MRVDAPDTTNHPLTTGTLDKAVDRARRLHLAPKEDEKQSRARSALEKRRLEQFSVLVLEFGLLPRWTRGAKRKSKQNHHSSILGGCVEPRIDTDDDRAFGSSRPSSHSQNNVAFALGSSE